MTTSIIVTLCILLLLAYAFDISSAKTKIPSVVLLLALGWGLKQALDFFQITMPNLSGVLPVLGTIGLILIVLEGSLELEVNRSKLGFVGKSALMAFLPLVVVSIGLAYAFVWGGAPSFKTALANAIPLAVISSAVAIPSAQNFGPTTREFITYESSLSDIFGVIFFNFIVLNPSIDAQSVGLFFVEIVGILGVTFVATLGLSYMLSKINHHVKFVPIVLMIILIYAIAKEYHLPALVFILFFGLFLQNLDELKHISFINKLHPEILNRETHKFREFIGEAAFLIRALFFLLFGYLINTKELLNPQTAVWALAITGGIFVTRGIFLKLFGFPVMPGLFLAPRGLITILLFLSIPISQSFELSNESLVIQVIIFAALVMMIGLMFTKKPHPGARKNRLEEKHTDEPTQ